MAVSLKILAELAAKAAGADCEQDEGRRCEGESIYAYLSTCALKIPAPPISALLYIGSLIGFVLLRALLQGDRRLAIAPERYVDCLVGMMAGQTDKSSQVAL